MNENFSHLHGNLKLFKKADHIFEVPEVGRGLFFKFLSVELQF